MGWQEIYLCVLLFLVAMRFIRMIFDIKDQEKEKDKLENKEAKGGDAR